MRRAVSQGMSSKLADEKAIRELIPSRADAMAPRVILYPLAEKGEWDGPVEIELPDPTILVDDDVAVAWGLTRMRGVRRGGETVDLWYRTTIVFQRQIGKWKVVHEHASIPTPLPTPA